MIRPTTAFVFACVVNLFLAHAIEHLVRGEPVQLNESSPPAALDIIAIDDVPPPPPSKPPVEQPKMANAESKPLKMPGLHIPSLIPIAQNIGIGAQPLNVDSSIQFDSHALKADFGDILSAAGESSLDSSRSSDLSPKLRVAPLYPQRALMLGVEGSVTVAFVVNTDGNTRDLKIIESRPPGIFERAAIRAISKWRYPKPDRDTPMRTTLKFELES